jgi:hypothetical protein
MRGFHTLAIASFFLIGCSSADDCEDLKARATALVDEFAACDSGRSCVVLDLATVVENACLGSFQCFAALAEGSDMADFSRRARALEMEFAACGECATADCANRDTLEAFCDTEQRRCRLRSRE